MSNFGLSCDVCNRENVGITWVNGMKFCAKCYQETFGNNTSKFVDLLNTEMYELKISNLEYKLNEKDRRITELEDKWNKLRKWAKNSTEVLLYSIGDKPVKLGNKKYNYFERKQLLDKMQELENGENK